MGVYTDPQGLLGFEVTTDSGERIGTVEQVYVDSRTGHPDWAAVHTGLFGHHVALIPLSAFDWTAVGSDLQVPFSRAAVRDAPHHDPGLELSVAEEKALFLHYGITHDDTIEPELVSPVDHERPSLHDVRRLYLHQGSPPATHLLV